MKKIVEKVAIVALICITLVFVLTAILYMTNILSNYNTKDVYDSTGAQLQTVDNRIVLILMIVLGAVYLGLSAYLLYVTFSERNNLRQILLFCDSDSATRTNIKVIDNIVKGCANQIEDIKIKKVKVRSDEKGGFIATVAVKVRAESVAEDVNKLRCLLDDSFKSTLNLTFNTINFEVTKLKGKYMPDVAKAEELTENLMEKQEECRDNYQEPLVNAEEPHEEPATVQKQEETSEKEENAEKKQLALQD